MDGIISVMRKCVGEGRGVVNEAKDVHYDSDRVIYLRMRIMGIPTGHEMCIQRSDRGMWRRMTELRVKE